MSSGHELQLFPEYGQPGHIMWEARTEIMQLSWLNRHILDTSIPTFRPNSPFLAFRGKGSCPIRLKNHALVFWGLKEFGVVQNLSYFVEEVALKLNIAFRRKNGFGPGQFTGMWNLRLFL